MALTMLCDICGDPCADGYHLVAVTKAAGAIIDGVLNLGTPQRVAVCRRCGASVTVDQLARLRGVAFPTDTEAATV